MTQIKVQMMKIRILRKKWKLKELINKNKYIIYQIMFEHYINFYFKKIYFLKLK